MSWCSNFRSIQSLTDLNTKFDNNVGPTENANSLATQELTTLELDPTLDIVIDQGDLDLTPTAPNPQISWAQESGISLVADQPPEILQRPLCVYFRPHKEAGYLGNDDIYYAIYLRERTTQNLVRQICRKLAIDEARVTDIVYLSPDKAIRAMNDQVVRGLFNEQSFDVEPVAASHDYQGDIDTVESLQMRIHL